MIRYIYIDDDPIMAMPLAKQFKEDDKLDCEFVKCNDDFNLQVDFFDQHNSLSGLILDLRLSDKTKAKYRGTTLAQQIRTSQKEGKLKSFPIILFSANDKLRESMESSDYNLFDYCFDKDDNDDDATIEANKAKLIAIANAYEASYSFASLGIDKSYLDERLVYELNRLRNQPKNVVVKFLITQVLEKQGALINEDVLFARLGIDKSRLEADKLLLIENKLSAIKYNGVLSEGWVRWWAPKLEELWETEIDNGTYLRSTSAKHRVELFSKYLGVDQLPVQPKIEMANSDRFWTICKDSHLPLDPIDGFLIQGQDSFFPWQEKEYVSKYYAKNSKNKDVWGDVAPIEQDRYNEFINA